LLPKLDLIAAEYFTAGTVLCKKCGTKIDPWETAREVAGQVAVSFTGLHTLGAHRELFVFQLSAGEHKVIDLKAYGVPDDATVLSVNYTPNGPGCFPLEMHGNTPARRILGATLRLYGMPLGEMSKDPAPISVLVYWIGRTDHDTESWFYFVDAIDALAARKYRQVIIPANTAVEMAIVPLVRQALRHHLPSTCKDEAQYRQSYFQALNVSLPLLSKIAAVPMMPEPIFRELNSLRSLRNDMVHEGFGDKAVDESRAAQLLCASLFGLAYVRFARPRLLS
jgi:hypothetical protein